MLADNLKPSALAGGFVALGMRSSGQEFEGTAGNKRKKCEMGADRSVRCTMRSEGTNVDVRKAVIPAAGLGTRFLPATKAVPKEMLPIVDTPTLQYIIEEAVQSGIEQILVVTRRDKTAIENHFDRTVELEHALRDRGDAEMLAEVRRISGMAELLYVRQKEPRGLGHAVAKAKGFVGDEPFAVLLGDDVVMSETPCLRQLLAVHQRLGGSILGVQPVPPEDVSKYGIVSGTELEPGLLAMNDMVEKPATSQAPSQMAVLGRYVLSPAIFSILEQTPPGQGGEIQLTDALRMLLKQESVYAYHFEGRRYDVGNKQGFLEATVETALQRPDLREPFLQYLRTLVANLPQR